MADFGWSVDHDKHSQKVFLNIEDAEFTMALSWDLDELNKLLRQLIDAMKACAE